MADQTELLVRIRAVVDEAIRSIQNVDKEVQSLRSEGEKPIDLGAEGIEKSLAGLQARLQEARKEFAALLRSGTATEKGLSSLRSEITRLESTIKFSEGEIAKLGPTTRGAVDEANRAMASGGTQAGALRSKIINLVGAYISLRSAVHEFKKEIEAGLFTTRAITNLVSATGSTEKARKEFEYLAQTAQKFGISLEGIAPAYTQFLVSTRGTRLEGEKAREVFEGFATEIAALHAPADKAYAVFYALTQIMSQGTVRTQDLRIQLGNALPDALQNAARATGTTVAGFNKMLERGEVISDEFLPKLAKVIKEKYGDAAVAASKDAVGSFERFNNAILIARSQIAEGFIPTLGRMAEKIGDTSKTDQATNAFKRWGQGIGAVISSLAFVPPTVEVISAALSKLASKFFTAVARIEEGSSKVTRALASVAEHIPAFGKKVADSMEQSAKKTDEAAKSARALADAFDEETTDSLGRAIEGYASTWDVLKHSFDDVRHAAGVVLPPLKAASGAADELTDAQKKAAAEAKKLHDSLVDLAEATKHYSDATDAAGKAENRLKSLLKTLDEFTAEQAKDLGLSADRIQSLSDKYGDLQRSADEALTELEIHLKSTGATEKEIADAEAKLLEQRAREFKQFAEDASSAIDEVSKKLQDQLEQLQAQREALQNQDFLTPDQVNQLDSLDQRIADLQDKASQGFNFGGAQNFFGGSSAPQFFPPDMTDQQSQDQVQKAIDEMQQADEALQSTTESATQTGEAAKDAGGQITGFGKTIDVAGAGAVKAGGHIDGFGKSIEVAGDSAQRGGTIVDQFGNKIQIAAAETDKAAQSMDQAGQSIENTAEKADKGGDAIADVGKKAEASFAKANKAAKDFDQTILLVIKHCKELADCLNELGGRI